MVGGDLICWIILCPCMHGPAEGWVNVKWRRAVSSGKASCGYRIGIARNPDGAIVLPSPGPHAENFRVGYDITAERDRYAELIVHPRTHPADPAATPPTPAFPLYTRNSSSSSSSSYSLISCLWKIPGTSGIHALRFLQKNSPLGDSSSWPLRSSVPYMT